jgi:hypothetical protein
MAMKTIFDHIETVKGKPHHIRKRVAFASAFVGTTFVALIWLIGSLSLGNFAIAGSSFADSVGQGTLVTSGADSTNANLAGVGAASVSNTAAHIEIIDTTSSLSSQKKTEQTILPF